MNTHAGKPQRMRKLEFLIRYYKDQQENTPFLSEEWKSYEHALERYHLEYMRELLHYQFHSRDVRSGNTRKSTYTAPFFHHPDIHSPQTKPRGCAKNVLDVLTGDKTADTLRGSR